MHGEEERWTDVVGGSDTIVVGSDAMIKCNDVGEEAHKSDDTDPKFMLFVGHGPVADSGVMHDTSFNS